MKNIEIKANLKSMSEMKSLLESVGAEFVEKFSQNDTFFEQESGRRLKLREIVCHRENKPLSKFELIYYEREDERENGPKLSNYYQVKISDEISANNLLDLLSKIFKKDETRVKKKRHLYKVGQSRIHLDEVEDLGSFLEIEVVLNEAQTESEGEDILRKLMVKLKVQQCDLLQGSYNDLLKQKRQQE